MTTRPDVNAVLRGLKPFQRDTVEYVFDRLYHSPEGSHRFLIADEVGLGKTLVARGIIAKAIDHMWDNIDRIDIVYICSNADIARQNINRLNITGQVGFAHASRLTLLPAILKGFDRKLNFVSFTPGTSFDLKSSTGIQQERALLFHLLRKRWDLPYIPCCNVMQCDVGDKDRWRASLKNYKPGLDLDSQIVALFFDRLKTYIAREKEQGLPDLHSRFLDLCTRFAYYQEHRNLSRDKVRERNRVIGELRAILAGTCLKALEPDLVILDEFQRFKHLLNDDSDAGLLAQELFSYTDEDTDVRTILLSATPYKMYTLYEESGEDDHYQDFLATLEFLENNPRNSAEIKLIIEEYRREMYRFGNGDSGRLLILKQKLETALRKTMVRTERITSMPGHDDMLTEISNTSLGLPPSEIKAYLAMQTISGMIGQGEVIEYWKSAPYLLNFMDHYKFKEAFVQEINGSSNSRFTQILRNSPKAFLSWKDIQSYQQVDPGNARLRKLMVDLLDNGDWRLLWTPPSLPYYELAGAFKQCEGKNITKRLVFSSWTVVPKVLAAIVSYEVERRMYRSFEENPVNTAEERQKRRPLLQFAFSNERLTGMPVLGLLYPSFTLARLGDPLPFFKNRPDKVTETLKSTDILTGIEQCIIEKLAQLPDGDEDLERSDESWYWAAPILLDIQEDKAAAEMWLKQAGLPQIWSGSSKMNHEGGGDSRWADHVDYAAGLMDGETLRLGRRPKDLSWVLAQMALAGPAVAALRSLCRISDDLRECSDKSTRNKAGCVAWGFRKLFNRPEVTALIRGMKRDVPYWRSTLEYCVDGGLQAVLDEYAHILQEFLGVSDLPPDNALQEVANTMTSALSLMTSRVELDDISFKNPDHCIEIRKKSMRNHFALRFGVQQSDDGNEKTREDHVRTAFNSPFWPFVLASTSVGQEGLDFHLYCHALIHWNLPSNPVDMEQREGRIHRYKGHAVRKNLAKRYADCITDSHHPDPWADMFEMARNEHWEASRGLIPFWSFPIKDGARIERHVPTLPLSQDIEKLQALKKSLVIYRMVFGQTRQEDMIDYLLSRLGDADVDAVSRQLQIELGPPKSEDV
ncbi:DEAD/DEAH box helicase:helicase, C-terminal [Desulforapulum autotrophicum HRM2]|uniref:DEAD/DEAH box helicase:helicase, C-terminal n=1 Tax=Desulforapulum autotrophicum (strain ATCC 43914 / DSM 3382 / VKM B-1955 / HRM2) TaxID=177437 RepID=C0QF07_DESAH|nr:helicase-related protein [Desulforapulum autotrophicum]ACN17508.1 DEAD/DEAH box helicase:helicase, C-terminal [Desulforapulum autotrophicum HRM2]